MNNLRKSVFVLFYILAYCSASRVLELSDKFSDIYKEGGYWLVKFYAPWCGHCKRLEPIWAQVAQALYKTNVRVGRVDCTRFPSLATEFSVKGFPTVMFIKHNEQYIFHGDRTKDDIVNFAVRMAGPPVQEVTRSESLNNLKQLNQLFFTYVGDKEGPLWDAYYTVAEKLQPHGFFYSVSNEIGKTHVDVDKSPAVFVYKEALHYFYTIESASDIGEFDEVEHLNNSMYKWINEERFETFPKITRGNINEILQTKKYLVLVVVEENKLQQISQEMLEFRDLVESVIRKKRDKYHKYFQFGWIGSPELANSIAMQVLPLPHLLVLNSTTNHHHIPEDEPSHLTAEAIDMFLERIHNQSAPKQVSLLQFIAKIPMVGKKMDHLNPYTSGDFHTEYFYCKSASARAATNPKITDGATGLSSAYGGNGLAVRIYRTYFEARTSLADMWKGNPVLTTVLFGLPLGFLTLILYSICCVDILDADEEEEELIHEKRE